ncbi:hypothetical protein [uncultured Ilyobacter sp.]|uniref:hypothetical protein n=1 Tax=uncultured Ilyobacter sp. TaxID=544433 RepID=UPI0029C0BD3B|nr:hypothetical protein [uncultured Ilyobacter sp.]
MAIPVLKVEDFLNEGILQETADIHGLSTEEITDLIENPENPKNLNIRAENYLSIRLGNRVTGLSEGNWKTLKEYYIQWKLYESVELEKETEDKKKTLDDLIKGILSMNLNTQGEKKIPGIMKF